jgi:hypothetical protein
MAGDCCDRVVGEVRNNWYRVGVCGIVRLEQVTT